MSEFWIHPSLLLIARRAPAAADADDGSSRAGCSLVPLLVFARVLTGMAKGVFGESAIPQVDADVRARRRPEPRVRLHHGVDVLIGTLYGMHVEENGQHIAAWVYVAGSLGAIYAGDLLTLFLFWELMAFSSVFLIWFRRRPESLAAGFRYLLVHVAGGVALLAGIMLHIHATGSIAFAQFDVKTLARRMADPHRLHPQRRRAAAARLAAGRVRRGHVQRLGVSQRVHDQDRGVCAVPRVRRPGILVCRSA
jgi:multicomponent Na+:H+ antiporter subunit D